MDVTYWNKRATKGCIYRGERFYTISAVPYYWKRREFVVRKLKDIIIKNDYKMVCDIGCGDGEYIHKLLHTCHDVFFEGIDSSPEMIFAASDRMNEDSRVDSDRYHLNISSDGIKDDKNYDLIYICCVAAHLENSKVLSLVKNAYLHLNSGGRFVLIEQTAPYFYSGKGFKRRTNSEYIALLSEVGFCVENSLIIDFWVHRLLLEKTFVKKRVQNKKNSDQFRLALNNKRWYRLMSSLCLFLSGKYVYSGFDKSRQPINRWGYLFLECKKN